jgi:hypothetical protein
MRPILQIGLQATKSFSRIVNLTRWRGSRGVLTSAISLKAAQAAGIRPADQMLRADSAVAAHESERTIARVVAA